MSRLKPLPRMFLPARLVRVAFVDRLLQLAIAAAVLVPQIDVGGPSASRVAGDQDAFEQLVRILLHQDAVVERAGSLSSPLTHR